MQSDAPRGGSAVKSTVAYARMNGTIDTGTERLDSRPMLVISMGKSQDSLPIGLRPHCGGGSAVVL